MLFSGSVLTDEIRCWLGKFSSLLEGQLLVKMKTVCSASAEETVINDRQLRVRQGRPANGLFSHQEAIYIPTFSI